VKARRSAIAVGARAFRQPFVNRAAIRSGHGRDARPRAAGIARLLDDPDRDDWDELLAANRALIKAIETGEPMTRWNGRIVAEYLREAGWSEGAIGAATGAAPVRALARDELPNSTDSSPSPLSCLAASVV
jgi:hypothetical protein